LPILHQTRQNLWTGIVHSTNQRLEIHVKSYWAGLAWKGGTVSGNSPSRSDGVYDYEQCCKSDWCGQLACFLYH
jgi:hypothetical protein